MRRVFAATVPLALVGCLAACEIIAGLGDDRHLAAEEIEDASLDAPVDVTPSDTGADVNASDARTDAALSCGRPKSCATAGPGRGADCAGTLDCCDSIAVPGGKFFRMNDVTLPATISSFCLDRFEVTNGRLRAFVD